MPFAILNNATLKLSFYFAGAFTCRDYLPTVLIYYDKVYECSNFALYQYSRSYLGLQVLKNCERVMQAIGKNEVKRVKSANLLFRIKLSFHRMEFMSTHFAFAFLNLSL